MLQGTFDQPKAKLSSLIDDLKTRQAPEIKERCLCCVSAFSCVCVCVTETDPTSKAMRYLTWKQELCQPLDWTFAVQLGLRPAALPPLPWCFSDLDAIYLQHSNNGSQMSLCCICNNPPAIICMLVELTRTVYNLNHC